MSMLLLPVATFVVPGPKANREAPVFLFCAMTSAAPLALIQVTSVVACLTIASTHVAMNALMALTGDHFKEFTATKCDLKVGDNPTNNVTIPFVEMQETHLQQKHQ